MEEGSRKKGWASVVCLCVCVYLFVYTPVVISHPHSFIQPMLNASKCSVTATLTGEWPCKSH